MDASERTRLRALCEATELPWRGVDVTDGGTVLGHGTAILRPHSRWLVRRVTEVDMGDGAEHDTAHAALIVGAVNALPALLDALDATERERDSLRLALDLRNDTIAAMRERATESAAACAATERERDDARAEVETLRAEAALLRSIIEGRTTPPTDAEIKAHAGWWRCVAAVTSACADCSGSAWAVHLRDHVAHHRIDTRWWPLDDDGRPCAWPTVTP